jgi:hypothetical protein
VRRSLAERAIDPDIDGVQIPSDNARSIPFVLQKDDERVDVFTDRTIVQSSTNLRVDTKC